jgi:uncharacterized protein YndB with AHSA1/START domain
MMRTMKTHERSLQTSAPPEKVWRIWSDISTWPQWNPDVTAISLDGPFANGTTGSMTTKAGGTHKIQLQDVHANRGFTLVTNPAPLSTFHFRCEVSAAPGGSRISQGVSMSGVMGGLMSAMMGERVAEGFTGILAGLKKRAESA